MKTALILAGGAGTRLWPASTDERPKQFLRLFGGKSLIRLTFERLSHIVDPDAIWVATNSRYRAAVLEEIPELSPERVLLEPARRNTAPAIAVCCARIRSIHPDATLGIFPSDHAIGDEESFIRCVADAFTLASGGELLVTIGIEPTEPNTGYGYLELGDEIPPGRQVRRFVEKPDLATAEQYVASGHYLWNGGMFIWKLDTFFRALAASAPDLERLTQQWIDSEHDARDEIYGRMPSISIDYALMERSSNVATIPGAFGWSDVGTWKALTSHSRGRTSGVHRLRSDGSWVHSERSTPVAVVGLPNVAVVETPHGLLVLNLDDDAGLSDLVREIESSSRKDA